MKLFTVMCMSVILFAISLIPASAQVYVPLATYEDGQQIAETSETFAEILALLQAEGVEPETIEAVRAELQVDPSDEAIQPDTIQPRNVQLTDSDATYTGCLLRGGIIINVAVGEQPKRPCSRRARNQLESSRPCR